MAQQRSQGRPSHRRNVKHHIQSHRHATGLHVSHSGAHSLRLMLEHTRHLTQATPGRDSDRRTNLDGTSHKCLESTPNIRRHQSPISSLGQCETYFRTSRSHSGGHCSCPGPQRPHAHYTHSPQPGYTTSYHLDAIRNLRTTRPMATGIHAKSSYSQQLAAAKSYFGVRTGHPQLETSVCIR